MRDGEDVDTIMKLTEELTGLHERMEILQGYNYEESVVKILEGLGFTPEEQERPVNTFSGGWKMRVELAKILLANPDVMLLDEPTNHLDIESIEWLENFLLTFSGAVVLISHDRKFLDNCTSRTIEITNGRLFMTIVFHAANTLKSAWKKSNCKRQLKKIRIALFVKPKC